MLIHIQMYTRCWYISCVYIYQNAQANKETKSQNENRKTKKRHHRKQEVATKVNMMVHKSLEVFQRA